LVKIAPFLLMSIGIYILYYGFSIFYRMPLHIPMAPFLFGTILFLLAVSFIGILVSIIIPSQLKATEILMVIATPSFILSGFTWPLSQMPDWVVHISKLIPLTHYLEIFRVLVIEQGTVENVRSSIAALAWTTVICFILSFVLLYLKVKKTKKEDNVPIKSEI